MGGIASLISAILTFIMALLQLSLTFGAPFGEYVLGGQYRVLPPKMRYTSTTFSIIFTIIALAFLQKGKILILGIGSTVVSIIIIINTIFLAYAIVGNGFITKSRKERLVMTPASILGFLCSVAALIWG
jgi:hypothetical protein